MKVAQLVDITDVTPLHDTTARSTALLLLQKHPPTTTGSGRKDYLPKSSGHALLSGQAQYTTG